MATQRTPLENCWYAVATIDAVDDGPISIEILDTAYVIWRGPDKTLIAARDRCSHREAPLSRGTIEDGCLRCPYHGWLFADHGQCVEIPTCNPECELCDGGSCLRLCGNPYDREAQTITIIDSLYILRASVELETCNLCTCDVNGSMMITAVDALASLRMLVGLPGQMICPEFATIEEAPTSTTSTTVPNNTVDW